MGRININLPDYEHDTLDSICVDTESSKAEVIKNALNLYRMCVTTVKRGDSVMFGRYNHLNPLSRPIIRGLINDD